MLLITAFAYYATFPTLRSLSFVDMSNIRINENRIIISIQTPLCLKISAINLNTAEILPIFVPEK